jgi:hypothetical protein
MLSTGSAAFRSASSEKYMHVDKRFTCGATGL